MCLACASTDEVVIYTYGYIGYMSTFVATCVWVSGFKWSLLGSIAGAIGIGAFTSIAGAAAFALVGLIIYGVNALNMLRINAMYLSDNYNACQLTRDLSDTSLTVGLFSGVVGGVVGLAVGGAIISVKTIIILTAATAAPFVFACGIGGMLAVGVLACLLTATIASHFDDRFRPRQPIARTKLAHSKIDGDTLVKPALTAGA